MNLRLRVEMPPKLVRTVLMSVKAPVESITYSTSAVLHGIVDGSLQLFEEQNWSFSSDDKLSKIDFYESSKDAKNICNMSVL